MTFHDSRRAARRKTVWGPKRTLLLLLVLLFGFSAQAVAAGKPNGHDRKGKLDGELTARKNGNPNQTTRVIVRLVPGAQLPSQFKRFARPNGKLSIINGLVLDLPNRVLAQLEARPEIFLIDYDRPTGGSNFRTSITVGARAVQAGWGVTGSGVGVAVIDSGVSTWHDDLTNNSAQLYPFGNQRVSAFVDFVNGRTTPYDDNGHGTHVAGIIAGNGYDSAGEEAGMAPDASIVSLKVLDGNGRGTISHSIAALDWVLQNHAAYNIRVVNMSVGAGVHESYWTDPFTLAAKQVVEAGVVVVSAAGNFGNNAAGLPQYGGVTAPGNAPWVLTVGASSTNGTKTRLDDTMAGFSSRGPTYLDWSAKPDLVAPGVGTVSLADPASLFYTTKAAYLLPGSISTANKPYLSLSGTSMAAPAVTGTVALMLQANPGLTPNAVKALLQYTAQVYVGYDPLTQGAGFLNSLGAVRLARFFAAPQPGQAYPTDAMWSHHIIWGNHMISGGVLMPAGSAWAVSTTWGVAKTDLGDNIVWGTMCALTCDNIVWGTNVVDNIVWGTGDDDNIVWGTDGDDNIVWGTSDDNIVWGTGDDDNIVWGTGDDDNIVWGTDCGGADCDNIVWGTIDADNIVWGTAELGDNIIWGTDGVDNIVWGTDGYDNIVWGTDDNIVWGTEGDDNIVWGTTTIDGVTWVIKTYLDWLWNYYYADYSQYLDWFTDSQYYEYTDMLTGWVNSLAAWLAAPADTTTTPQ